ncbi:putative 3'-5' exonuclease related to the exonuclease domain of PolB [compost metagenome]
MLSHISLSQIIFLDIETVPLQPDFLTLNEEFQHLWELKSGNFRKDDQSAADVYTRAGIFAEFGKIICITIGRITEENDDYGFRLKSFYGDDERTILNDFAAVLRKQKRDKLLCAHNGREFDYPFLSRRMLINGIELPPLLDIAGKRPWEINHLDTMELWKFGDYKNYTSLRLLAAVLNIPTPKDDIDGSQVGAVYWEDHDLERIKTYCEKDVLPVAQIILRFKGKALIPDENVARV